MEIMAYSRQEKEDILRVLRAKGALTKDDIVTSWDLNDADYHQLVDALDREAGIGRGPKGSGGFLIKSRRPPAEADDGFEEWADDALPEWERLGAHRLADLLSYQELENLLGGLLYTVRQSRKTRTGADRRGTKAELAAALIVQHGADLFADKDIRHAVAKRSETEAPKRWCSGKGTASRFVAVAGFPREFAGLPSDEMRPDFEYIEPRLELRQLADFQCEVSEKLLQLLSVPQSRGIVTLPTGAGKTRVAVDTIRDWMIQYRHSNGAACVIWLAHTEELCEQAYASFKQVWEASAAAPPLWLFRFWGQYTKDIARHNAQLANMLAEPTVLISTPHRLRNFLIDAATAEERSIVANLHRVMRVIVIDEAHRAAAPLYREILIQFSAEESNACVIGLTATPFRKEYLLDDPEQGTKELREIFKRILEPTTTLGMDPRRALIQRGVLAKPDVLTIPTRTVLSAPEPAQLDSPTEQELERIDHALRLRADNPARRSLVFEHILPIAKTPGSRILYFGPSVADAECMAFLLREAGIRAAAVSAKTRDVTRRRLVTEFRDGEFTVLCNCEVLTTGFDAPKVTHIVMARPTVSQVLYEQMVGRGLRGPEFGGTETCNILDCEDNYRQGRPTLGYLAFRHLWMDQGEDYARSA
jgi:superfamily II DNA or RNA helicase